VKRSIAAVALLVGYSFVPVAFTTSCGSACDGLVTKRVETASGLYDLTVSANQGRGPEARNCHVQGSKEQYANCTVGAAYPDCAK